jgi:ribosome maturation factor RimP
MVEFKTMMKNRKELKKIIVGIIKETITEQFPDEGIELIDLELKGNESSRIVRVFIDKEGGITLDDCANFSNSLSVVLDSKDPIESKYTLEVSSPGGRQKKTF